MNKRIILLVALAAAVGVAIYARRRYAAQLAGKREKAAAVAPTEGLHIDVDTGEPVLKPE